MKSLSKINKVLLIDVDGTLLDNTLEMFFRNKITELGLSKAIVEFNKLYKTDFLEVNDNLMKHLELIKMNRDDVAVVLWTNRGSKFKKATINNLQKSKYCIVFDEYYFCGGKKADYLDKIKKQFNCSNLIVYDDREEYVSLGNKGSKLFNFQGEKYDYNS